MTTVDTQRFKAMSGSKIFREPKATRYINIMISPGPIFSVHHRVHFQGSGLPAGCIGNKRNPRNMQRFPSRGQVERSWLTLTKLQCHLDCMHASVCCREGSMTGGATILVHKGDAAPVRAKPRNPAPLANLFPKCFTHIACAVSSLASFTSLNFS